MKAVVAAGRRPDRQDGEGLMARWATTAPDADEIVNIIVRLLTAQAVADDRSIPAQRAQAGKQGQWKRGHPGSMLCSASGSAINRINGWREGLPLTVAVKFRSEAAFTLPVKSVSNEKRIPPSSAGKLSLVPHFGRYKSVTRDLPARLWRTT